MPVPGRSATGTLLKIGNGASPEVFTAVTNIGDIAGPAVIAATIDVSNHNDTTGYRRFIASLKEGGDVTFNVYWLAEDTTQNQSATGLFGLLNGGLSHNMQVVEAGSPVGTWSFIGLVTGFKMDYKVAGAQTASVTIKIDGVASHA